MLQLYLPQFYDIGGEEYLTFSGTRINLGGGMDAKSGVFTVLASFYDQIHERLICWILIRMILIDIPTHQGLPTAISSNHKNSMGGQSIVAELAERDRVQVKMTMSSRIGKI